MPPTRGHDLKQHISGISLFCEYDAPHTGARLETLISAEHISYQLMPPTRGHDLKPVASTIVSTPLLDAPHTGARLETKRR